MAKVGFKSAKIEEWKSEYPLDKNQPPREKARSQDKKLDEMKANNLDDLLALSSSFQKPTYRVLIYLGVNIWTSCILEILLDTSDGPSLVNSHLLQPISRQI